MRRFALGVTLALTLVGAAVPPARAQESQRTDRRFPRRLLFSLVGLGTGAAAGASYVATKGQSQPGTCGKPECVFAVTAISGALIGYMIGREFDELHMLRYRGGAPLAPRSLSQGLLGEPGVLAASDTLVAVGGTAGVQLFRTGAELRPAGRRANGVRGIVAVDIAPTLGALAVGSASGLYLYQPGASGVLVREGDVSATAASADRVYFAAGTRIEAAPVGADTARGWPGVTVGSPVRDLELDGGRGVLWAITDDELIAFRSAGDSLERSGSTALSAGGRRVTIDGTRLAAALGEGGVLVFDVSDPSRPDSIGAWSGARFAYDVSLAGDRLYVAAGPEGVYVLNIASGAPTTLGLARELGFAAALVSRNGFTYLIDRSTNALRRIDSNFVP